MGVDGLVVEDSWQTYIYTRRGLIVPNGFFYSWLGEERPLVRHSIVSPRTETYILSQLCNNSAYRDST